MSETSNGGELDDGAELAYGDAQLRAILHSAQTIAMVGISPRWNRPSFFAMKYLQAKGYRIVPVNPGAAGQTILGETCYASLAEVPGPIDMVDVFRDAEAAGAVVDEAIALKADKGIRVVWMQLGIRNDAAAARGAAAGLTVIMNRCPKIEYGRLHAELSWGGFNSRIISSRRRRARIL
ncbi:MAG: CoA-binding protein [Planctomycetota bacterium]|jgi:predicted CoA-binding protein